MRTPLPLIVLFMSCCSPHEFVVGAGDGAAEPFSVGEFRAEWATPSTIRWAWDSSGEPLVFDGFRLVLAATQAELEAGAPSRRIISMSENAELADWFLPGSDGPARTIGSTSTGHLPETSWFARLEWSSEGEAQRSNVASATTQAMPTGQHVIFHDTPPAPYTIPDTFVLGSAVPYAGTSNYEYHSDCLGTDSCWENLRFSEMAFDLSSVPEATLTTTAYLEFALAYRGDAASYWSEVFLQFTACPSCRYGYVGWCIAADDQYAVYQVPISALRSAGRGIPLSDWRSGLSELRIGGNWSQGGLVRIDEISLHW
jgi:hypothetical protein